MTDQDTSEPGEIEVPPLPAEMMARIGRLEPPPPEADFWDRLHVAFGADGADAEAATSVPGIGSPSRYRATLLAVAALVVVAGIGLQLLAAERSDPADDQPAPGAAATAPGEPLAEPAPTTTASVAANGDQQAPPPVPGTDPEPSATPGSGDGAAAVTVAVEPVTSSVVDSPARQVTASTGPQPSSTTARPASPRGPVRLQAEDNDLATDGAATWEGWQLWSNGYIEHELALAPGSYSIGVMAQGMATTTTRPRMELRIDGQAVGSTLVNLDAYRLYTFDVTVGPAGANRLEIAFTNDPNRPGNDVDLKIDYVEITPR